MESPVDRFCLWVRMNLLAEIARLPSRFSQSCRWLEVSGAEWENTTPSFGLMEL